MERILIWKTYGILVDYFDHPYLFNWFDPLPHRQATDNLQQFLTWLKIRGVEEGGGGTKNYSVAKYILRKV